MFFTEPAKHAFVYIENKKDLTEFYTSAHRALRLQSVNAKQQPLKECIARTLKFNKYASALSGLPLNVSVDTFSKDFMVESNLAFSDKLEDYHEFCRALHLILEDQGKLRLTHRLFEHTEHELINFFFDYLSKPALSGLSFDASIIKQELNLSRVQLLIFIAAEKVLLSAEKLFLTSILFIEFLEKIAGLLEHVDEMDLDRYGTVNSFNEGLPLNKIPDNVLSSEVFARTYCKIDSLSTSSIGAFPSVTLDYLISNKELLLDIANKYDDIPSELNAFICGDVELFKQLAPRMEWLTFSLDKNKLLEKDYYEVILPKEQADNVSEHDKGTHSKGIASKLLRRNMSIEGSSTLKLLIKSLGNDIFLVSEEPHNDNYFTFTFSVPRRLSVDWVREKMVELSFKVMCFDGMHNIPENSLKEV